MFFETKMLLLFRIGDSGGPLMAPRQENRESFYYQQGIISYGLGCGKPDIPSVYSRVGAFIDWIKEKVAE